MAQHEQRENLGELARLALKLGITAFGGPAAHIAMLRQEVVARRRWLSEQQFLDLLGATNLIPGPNSTEMVMHVGRERAGWRGLVAAGVLFILPAALIVLALAWAYVEYGARPEAAWLLYGIKPVIIAIVGQALWALGRTAVQSRLLAGLAIITFALFLLGINELLLLFGAGILIAMIRNVRQTTSRPPSATLLLLPGWLA
ncbi:MAG: chromate transporter, partial [Chloroflexota bacterium]|nr:chromate transporter [Chloroflexota bacterium]